MAVGFRIREATAEDVPALFALIKGLAEYERLLEQLSATEESLRCHLFGERQAAEAALAQGGLGDLEYRKHTDDYKTW